MIQNNHFEKLEFKQWEKLYFKDSDLIWKECKECDGSGNINCKECDSIIECDECNTEGGWYVEEESGLTLKQYYDNQRDKDNKLVKTYNA